MSNIEDGISSIGSMDFNHQLIQVIQHTIKFKELDLSSSEFDEDGLRYFVCYPKIGGFSYRLRIPVGREGMGVFVDGGNCDAHDNIQMVRAFMRAFGVKVEDLFWINPMEFKSTLDKG